MMPGMAPPFGLTEDAPQAFSPETQLEIPPGVLREPADQAAPPEPDAVNATSVESLALGDAPEGLLTELQERIHALENDKRRLQTELEELNGRLQAQPFHKEKDLLGLRETINRKEKDLLDLRDGARRQRAPRCSTTRTAFASTTCPARSRGERCSPWRKAWFTPASA